MLKKKTPGKRGKPNGSGAREKFLFMGDSTRLPIAVRLHRAQRICSLTLLQLLAPRVNDLQELWLQRSATDQEPINIRLHCKSLSVASVGGTTVHDANLLGDLWAHVVGHPLTDVSVRLLCLFRSGHNTSSNGPDWLLGNNNVAPISDLISNGGQLTSIDLVGLATLALVELLSDAQHHLQTCLQGICGLGCNSLVGLHQLRQGATLGVAQDDPIETGILDHICADLTSESSTTANPAVLESNTEIRSQHSSSVIPKQHRGRNDDFNTGPSKVVSFVQRADQRLDARPVTVALPVPSDDELTGHFLTGGPLSSCQGNRRGPCVGEPCAPHFCPVERLGLRKTSVHNS
mmetsp:Transcript_27463/g.46607  ORF Transcript_27463/g.46607 Transcript_27463/m.46607 type:complete len:347 (-) Transcript_27463:216-1256(-)